jgi:hypothetical protein
MSAKRDFRRAAARRQVKAVEKAVLLKQYLQVYGSQPVSQAAARNGSAGGWLRAWLPLAAQVARALFPTFARLLRRAA